jgi:hypothetical protein
MRESRPFRFRNTCQDYVSGPVTEQRPKCLSQPKTEQLGGDLAHQVRPMRGIERIRGQGIPALSGTRPGLVARRAAYARRSRCEHRFVFALVAPHPLSDGTAARRGLGCRL